MTGFVGAQHEFHDATFVQGWADRFVPTAPRLALFDLILEQVADLGKPAAHVLELGLGPGYMARHILDRNATISYEGLDFSDVFFEVAKKTIGPMMPRVTLTKADLMEQAWPKRLSRRPDAIISTWALHDLGSQQAIADVYARCHDTLPPGGILVNGDFIKPVGTDWTYEPGRFEIARHLELLRQAGFAAPASLATFEDNIHTPTSAQNYACLAARR
ncbi:MAG TPA: class I SAM-dependent methyltransferase [Rhodopila sp.]|jgi:SAM-dependent methyltransferase|nr:class I SAM-dependent methyltransferase [Rhodopila sp.]